jgi:hypothetical protein
LIDFSFSSNLPSDSLQRLRQEIEHLKERFTESITELETRTTFIKKTIKVSEFSIRNASVVLHIYAIIEKWNVCASHFFLTGCR